MKKQNHVIGILLTLVYLIHITACSTTEQPIETMPKSDTSITTEQTNTSNSSSITSESITTPAESTSLNETSKIEEFYEALSLAYQSNNANREISKIIFEFFTASLLENDYQTASFLLNPLSHYYTTHKFLEGVKISSIDLVKEISPENEYDVLTTYLIDIHVDESRSELFPVGISRWVLITGITESGNEYIYSFKKETDVTKEISDVTFFGYNYTLFSYLGGVNPFVSTDNFNTLVPPQSNLDLYTHYIHWMYHFVYRYYDFSRFEGEERDGFIYYSPQTFTKAAKELYGVEGLNFEVWGTYPEYCGHGGAWIYFDLVSEVKEGDIITVTINYYADTAYFLVSKSMRYKIKVKDDNNYSLLSTELLYDSNIPLAVNSL